MLFNSYAFIFAFLPLVLMGTWALHRAGRGELVRDWLLASSLGFYAWWNPAFLPVIVTSIGANVGIARWIGRAPEPARRRRRFGVGCALNLGALGYFKYANFFAGILAQATDLELGHVDVELPLAISFFTFQQIAFLADAVHDRELPAIPVRTYALFVAFFPQLIAGPIVHHSEVTPQLQALRDRPLRAHDLAAGLTLFFLGLFKKTVFADTVALHANEVFTAATTQAVDGFHCWTGTLAYTLQLYFDFSGYCDMAMGAALTLGVRLPINFDSPYKASNIVDFWRRWHITLSHFLRDYLYIPLGGNRRGPGRRYANLMTTMVLGGLWHGAGWTFVLWGALHGAYLAVNHAWHKARPAFLPGWLAYRVSARVLTFVSVMVAWVYFRASDLATANRMLARMFDPASLRIPDRHARLLRVLPESWTDATPNGIASLSNVMLTLLVLLTLVSWLAPNTHDIMAEPLGRKPTSRMLWRADRGWAWIMAVVAVWAIAATSQHHEFLYFQF